MSSDAPAHVTEVSDLPDIMPLDSLTIDFPGVVLTSNDENRDWYVTVEKYLMDISDECKKYCALHTSSSKRFNTYHDIVTISLILLPLSVSMLSLFSAVTSTKMTTGDGAFNILIGAIGLLGTSCGALNKVMRYSDKSSLHRISGNKYIQLHGSIVEQLYIPKSIRHNGILFSRWCSRTFFKIQKLTPFPSNFHIEKSSTNKITSEETQQPQEVVLDVDDAPNEQFTDYMTKRAMQQQFKFMADSNAV
jgi:hypothetical protein